MKYKILTLFLLLIFINPSFSNAQTIPFGGKLLTSYECTCSGGWLIYFYDFYTKTTLPIVFQFGYSRLNYAYNMFTPGVSIAGTYTPGGICMMGSSYCTPIPVVGTVTGFPFSGMGTSLSPAF